MSSAQVGIYGIGEANTDAVVQAALGALAASGLPYEIGGMSTVIDAGDDGQLFATLQAMYAAAASHGAASRADASLMCEQPAAHERILDRLPHLWDHTTRIAGRLTD